MKSIVKITITIFVFLLASSVDTALAASVEQDIQICGEYTYILPKNYKPTKVTYEYGTSYFFINDVPWIRTPKDVDTPSINCILENNNGDFSYRFSAKKELLLRTLAKEETRLKISKQKCDFESQYKIYFLAYSDFEADTELLSNNIIIEINEQGNNFDTIFAITLSKYDHNRTNEQIAEEMCALARQFIGTVKKR